MSEKKHILVVEDEKALSHALQIKLESEGYQVSISEDGKEASELIEQESLDLILLDVIMPRMDGFEVLRSVRRDENLKDLPVIMITSRTGEKHKQQAMELGVNQYLGKPFQEAKLLATIEEVIAGAKAKPEQN